MPVATRTATRIQDMDDANVSLGPGVDEYALVYDHDTARFVLRAMATGVTDHGALTGLSDDDHAGYALLAGRAGGTTIYGGTAANEDLTLEPTSHGTKTSAYVLLAPSGGNVGIGTTAPETLLHATSTTATTGAVRNVLTLGANVTSTGVGAVGLGAGLLFQAESSTTADRDQAQIASLWTTATDATRASALTFSTLTAGGSLTERMRIDGAGNVGIGTSAPANALDVNGYVGVTRLVNFGGTTDIMRLDGNTVRVYAQSSGFAVTSAATGAGVFTLSLGGAAIQTFYGAATNSVTDLLTIYQRTSGAPDVGLGSGVLLGLPSSTSNDVAAARIQALWYEATHVTRKADLVLTAYDTSEREGLRIRGAGSAPAIGFLGAAPIARIAHVADPAGGGTVDAEARSAINSILATLEGFGLHAVS